MAGTTNSGDQGLDPVVQEFIKCFPSRILTSSVKQRTVLFDQLSLQLIQTRIPSKHEVPVVKFIIKALVATLHVYRDRTSRHLVNKSIKEILSVYSDAPSILLASLLAMTSKLTSVDPSSMNDKTARIIYGWMSQLSCKHVKELDEESFKAMIGIHINMSHCGLATGRLRELWSDKIAVTEYAKRLAVLNNDSLGCLVLWSQIFSTVSQDQDLFILYKNQVLDLLMKHVIGSKTLVNEETIARLKPVVRLVSHEDFKDVVLPSLSRAVLRSPEVAMNIVAPFLSLLNIDLSQYSQDFGKMIGTHLHSKEEQLRTWAVSCCKCLAQQCSDPDAIEHVSSHLFSIYGGSEGKLTVVEQRLGVISGIGMLSHHAVSGRESIHSLSVSVIDQFITAMKGEIVEVILLHLSQEMQRFCCRLCHFPDSLVSWYKTCIASKTTTASLRSCFTSCLNAALTDNSVNDAPALEVLTLMVPICLKASVAPVAQIPVVMEGLKASLFVMRAAYYDPKLENNIKSVVTLMTSDTSKLTFLTEKFISSSCDEALISLVLVIERLFMDHESKVTDEGRKLLLCCLVLLLSHRSVDIRRKTITICKGIIISNSNSFLPSLLESMKHVLIDVSALPLTEEVIPVDASVDVKNNLLFPPGITHSLQEVCLVVKNSDYSLREQVILNAFLPSHVALMFHHDNKLWLSIMKKLLVKEDIDSLLKKRGKDLMMKTRHDNKKESLLRQNCIETLVRFFPKHFTHHLVEDIVQELQVSDLRTITRTDYEMFITPEGVLYETAILDLYKEVTSKNIKKEGKLYSFKEQMEELALRQEMESKAKDKEPVLNKKQQEAKVAQLEKEALVRQRIALLDASFTAAVDNLRSILKGNPFEAVKHLGRLIIPMTNLFTSCLCVDKAVGIYKQLGEAAFKYEDDQFLAQAVSYSTQRQLKAIGHFNKQWTRQDLVSVVERLHSKSITRESQDSIEWIPKLTVPAFSYCLPLLLSALFELSSDSDHEDQARMVLDIIAAHSRISSDASETDEKSVLRDPKLLPQLDLFNNLFDILDQVPYHLETQVSTVIHEVARSCSGGDGCDSITSDEVSRILAALLHEKECIRLTALDCLLILSPQLKQLERQDVIHRVYVAQFEESEITAPVARKIWTQSDFEAVPSLAQNLLNDISIVEPAIMQSIGVAMKNILESFPHESENVFTQLVQIYKDNNHLSPVVLDSFGRPTKESRVDPFKPRITVAIVLTETVHLAPTSSVQDLIGFFVPIALSDRNADVQTSMLEAAIKFVDSHGQTNIDPLLTRLQKFLETAKDSAANDAVRRSVIVLMGNLAKHMDSNDDRVKPIVVKLIESLSTPSQLVQEAVANCLPPLVPSFRDDAPNLTKNLLTLLFTSDSYGERKGAAYGIAGMVKGLGILALKQLDIMDQLMDAIQDKKEIKRREGALFTFETLCNMLGRLFEPYIVQILPHLLLCYGDKEGKVRKAADDTSRAVMKRLSAHGVKLVLPSLLAAVEQDAWRTKVGSVTLLGAMSYCAPKQLSSCLPSIVPKLMDHVLCDSHPKVQDAGARALKSIGSVIRNPEIQAIVPTLLSALQDPVDKTNKCLQRMLNTKFVHFIDSPSLALIMPVIERAFKSRSTETRKMAVQIIGNMYSLTDQKDLSPYLPAILPGLKAALIDPVPEVRAVASRALGAMVKGMGEEIVQEMMPWLLETLTSEGSSVDRSGAAQGLAEVIGALGLVKLEKFMPEIITTAERTDVAAHVRDGYMMLLIYLPSVFNKEFIPHIGNIVNPILKALADENEFVRETALLAGQKIVNMYADSAVQFLLPNLEQGLFDENWRIRLSSVQLMGDLLYKISGVTGKMTTETVSEDDNFGTEQSFQAILSRLGQDRRNRVFSGLYMGRSDVSHQVRQAALHVWKVVVTNTPRTLKEILPTLFGLILGCLASSSEEKQQIAARTLGDLVKKLGERVLPEIIPILEQGLKSDRADQRQGVCIGLSEIIASTSRDTVQAFSDSLVPTVTKALYDPLPEVRTAAGKTFDSLHSACGGAVLDEILPIMLNLLGDPVQGEHALDGLKQIMTTKGRVVLPYLVPQLTSPPANTRALSLLSPVAGDALSKHLAKILPAILSKLSKALDTSDEKQEIEYCQAIILSVSEDIGVRTIIDYLLEASKAQEVNVRRAAVMLIHVYSCHSRHMSGYVSQLLRGLIFLFTDKNESVLLLVWEAIHSITKSLDARAQMNLVPEVRSAIRYAVTDVRPPKSKIAVILPGLSLTKGIGPIIPVFREAILNGSPEQKEQASQGLSELIEVTSPEALKPSVINIAGPLIRILGDRYAWSVKVSVLDTLTLLLTKVGPQLRPFLPQLQQTFLKALADSHKQVRLKSAHALSRLVQVHTKCDSVVQEIHNLVKGDDAGVKETALFALRMTLLPAGDKIADGLAKTIISTVSAILSSPEDTHRIHAAACLGTFCKWMSQEDLSNTVKNYLFRKDSQDWTLIHGCAVALRIALKVSPERISVGDWMDMLVKGLSKLISSDRVPLVINGLKGTAYLLLHEIVAGNELNPSLMSLFSRSMNHSSNEVKLATVSSSVFLAKNVEAGLPIPFLKSLVPLLVNGTKEKNTMVKTGSEQALISVLRLRKEDDLVGRLTSALDPGPQESLQDCIQKTLKRVMSQAEPKEEEFDDTLTP